MYRLARVHYWRQEQRAFHLDMQARSGLITGLALFPAKEPDVIDPFQKMYTDCSRFQEWHCKQFMNELSLKDNAACKGPTTCLPGSADVAAEKAQPDPKAAAQPQVSASAQVGGTDGGEPRNYGQKEGRT